MKKFILFITFISIIKAQSFLPPSYETYKSTPEQIHDLRHTKLKVKFDFEKKQLIGEEWITLEPHFYPSDKLKLDAKSMDIYEVRLIKKNKRAKSLKYKYKDNKFLIIDLDKEYKAKEKYTIYISYRAKPEEIKNEGNKAIQDSKGLYFISSKENPKLIDQIWTQGEPDDNNAWFPTIDEPNQKTTQEIYITIPNEFVSLSNGLLISQSKNTDGTHTDYWKMDLPHAPYLFFIGVGKYEITRDKWKNIPLSYYLEKKYAPFSKEIFGNTPEILSFFSKITGVDYPWPSYNQIVVRDFVSGAMENTTAVSFYEGAYQMPGELIDENKIEDTIAHEAFHHWFGDLVTMESLSNLTLHESFASYSEYLWNEYKYGKEFAESKRIDKKYSYLNENAFYKNLARFDYKEKREMFDSISYSKGSAILHMLRKFIGNDAFEKSMHEYLTRHKFSTAEVHNWRMAVEKITGKDLNWFFDQWYYSNGYPKLEINHDYDQLTKKISLKIFQRQKGPLFEFPYTIDLYEKNGKKKRVEVWVRKQKENVILLDFPKKPSLVNIDPEGILISEVKENKNIENYFFQYKHTKEYYSRYRAIEEAGNYLFDFKDKPKLKENITNHNLAFEILSKALKDSSNSIKEMALSFIDPKEKTSKNTISLIEKMSKNSSQTLIQAQAISKLAELKNKKYESIFESGLQSKSYSVIKASLGALLEINPTKAYLISKEIYKKHPDFAKEFNYTLAKIAIENKDLDNLDKVASFIGAYILLPRVYEEIKSGNYYKYKYFKKGFDWIVSTDDFVSTAILTRHLFDFYKKSPAFIYSEEERKLMDKNPDLFEKKTKEKYKNYLKELLGEALKAKKEIKAQDQIEYIKQALENFKEEKN